MTDESLLLDALAAWHADRTRPAAELLPGRPDLGPRLAADIRKVLDVESAAGTPPPADPDETTDPDGDESEPADLLDLLEPSTHPGDIGSVAGYRAPGPRPGRAAVARFRREAAALRAVDHPGVVPVLAVGEHRRAPVLVMPRLNGETLEERLRQHPDSQPEAIVRFAAAVCDALAAALSRTDRLVPPSGRGGGRGGRRTGRRVTAPEPGADPPAV